MSDRRNFLRSGGLLGFLAMGAAAPVLAGKIRETQVLAPVAGVDPNIIKQIEQVDPNIIKQIEQVGPANVTFTSTYGEIAPPPPPPPPSNGMSFYTVGSTVGSNIGYNEVMRIDSSGNLGIGGSSKRFVPGTEKQVSVKMVPGPDGELYINVNGQWKRVLTA